MIFTKLIRKLASVIGHAFVSFHLFHEGLDDHSLIMQESRNERAFYFFF